MDDMNMNNGQRQPGPGMDHHHHDHQGWHDCGMCGWGGHRHFMLRWLLGLLILAFTFWLGVKVGEFKSSYDGYGMDYYGNGQMMRQYRPNMMYWQNGNGTNQAIPPMMQQGAPGNGASPLQK